MCIAIKLTLLLIAAVGAVMVAFGSLPAQQRQVTLQADLPTDLPPLASDPVKFQQVLLNLLTNALHITSAGGRIAVAAREERSAARNSG